METSCNSGNIKQHQSNALGPIDFQIKYQIISPITLSALCVCRKEQNVNFGFVTSSDLSAVSISIQYFICKIVNLLLFRETFLGQALT